MLNAFTVDFEDWYRSFEIFKVNTRHRFENRIEQYCHEILEFLNRHNTRATFFVLGYIAEKYPHLIKSICDANCETGSHEYGCGQIFVMNPVYHRPGSADGNHGMPFSGHRSATMPRSPA